MATFYIYPFNSFDCCENESNFRESSFSCNCNNRGCVLVLVFQCPQLKIYHIKKVQKKVIVQQSEVRRERYPVWCHKSCTIQYFRTHSRNGHLHGHVP